MSINRNGYYDDEGQWQRTKFCFVFCGEDRCTCQPPLGLYYNKAFDKRIDRENTDDRTPD